MNTFSRTSLDALYVALGGFAEPEPNPHDLWKERLRKLWMRSGMTTDEIARQLDTTGANVRVQAMLMGLPSRMKPRKHPNLRRQLMAAHP